MNMFWWLWTGFLFFLGGTWLGVYSWNGALLGLLNRARGRKYWVASVALSAVGLALLLVNTLLLSDLACERVIEPSFLEFWGAIAVMAIGTMFSIILTQAGVLKATLVPKDSRIALFYAGLALLALGFLALLWLMLPDNLLYGVVFK